MLLRKGKTKITLASSIDASLLAVEIYNKPRTLFRVEGFITQMIIAWTRLFHAHFNHTIGNKYYYKNAKGHYKKVDGEKKSWELKTCIKEHKNLDEAINAFDMNKEYNRWVSMITSTMRLHPNFEGVVRDGVEQ